MAIEMNSESMQALAASLQQTLSPDAQVRKQAERFLESVEASPNYTVVLLTLVKEESVDIILRVAAAITFKNTVKRNWRIIDGETSKINDTDRETVRNDIVDLMLKSPEKLQKQLSEAISVIGREDFPDRWPNLLPSMVEKFKNGDFHIINGVLQTAHSIFKRYRHEFKSQELWLEIKFVLEKFAEPLTTLFKDIMDAANKCAGDVKQLKVIFGSILLICKIFYSLNFQDLPEHFEDNLETWMKNFLILLTTDNKLLETAEDDEEAGPLELVKSQICDNVALYAQKYDEEFQVCLPQFVEAIWHLLTTTGNQPKHDLLVSNAIQFLASVCERPHYKYLFEEKNTLQSICEKVIVPNMEFRDADEELFEDNPEEYIRRDIEGSDFDTRRRAACDFVRGLCKFHEQQVIGIFSHYVLAMLEQYNTDQKTNWKSKDAAIFLVTSLASKKQTTKHGTTQASELVDLVDFFTKYILPELQIKNVHEHPVLKADSIKYIMTFRSMLPRDLLVGCLPLLTNHLSATSHVVHSYAAHCIDRILMLRTPGGEAPISVAEVKPFLEQLLSNLFSVLDVPGSQENEYIMKCIMRTFSMLQEDILPFVKPLLTKLALKLSIVSKNPSKPQFNHYIFEAICCAIRATCKKNKGEVAMFEKTLFPVMHEILVNDVTEFLPYIFQVLSLLLEIREDGIPDPYMELFSLLLTPVLWERTGNIPPLVRLLQAYIEKGSSKITEGKTLNGLLGVFQKLLASKTNDHEGFYLLNSMVEHMDPAALSGQMKQIFILLFQRLQSSKTTKYVKSLNVFLCLYAVKYGAAVLVETVDSIQAQLFGMLLQKVIISDVQKVSGHMERKICAVGMTKLLTECPPLIENYADIWGPLLHSLISVFELPEDDTVPDDEHFIEIEDTPGYQTAYSQLVFAGKKEHDPFGGAVPDAKVYLAQCLHKLSLQHPGKVMPMINTGVPADAVRFLEKYIQAAQVTLA